MALSEREKLFERIFGIRTDQEFQMLALDIFRYQAKYNGLYNQYLTKLSVKAESVQSISEIPFMPIEFFKTFKVITGSDEVQTVFRSSGTTSDQTSCHYVHDIKIYEQSFRKNFEQFYGSPESWCILALLPSYQEREDSSLIFMMRDIIASSLVPGSGFYLDNTNDLVNTLNKCRIENRKTLLFGVTFALLEFVQEHQIIFPELTVMETGGMKGRKKEMVREEVHSMLCKAFGVQAIHSEYGMTELLSQAYSKGHGIFEIPPWMRVFIRDTEDPLSFMELGRTGGINVIDLANLDSCSFIATQDLGRMNSDYSFEVLGRFDYSDVRGCNLLI